MFKEAEASYEESRQQKQNDISTVSAYMGCQLDQGRSEKALALFEEMEEMGIRPDRVAYITALRACADSQSLQQGKKIHEKIIENSIPIDDFLGATLISMYRYLRHTPPFSLLLLIN